MANFKENCTLNERDSLIDLLNLEKQMIKIYATAMTEGASKGFRQTVKNLLSENIDLQFSVFSLLTRKDYLRVQSAMKEDVLEEKNKFKPIKSQLA